MEMCTRVLVLAAQVNAGMWKRNGYSISRQVGAYQYHYPRGMMYDKDIVMLQVRGSFSFFVILSFFFLVIYIYRVIFWTFCYFDTILS